MASKSSNYSPSLSSVTGPSMDRKVQEYKNSVTAKGEELILKGFPDTIVRLNKILETPQFLNRELVDVHQDLNIPVPSPKMESDITVGATKVVFLPTGSVQPNKNLTDLIEIVKPHIRKLMEDCNLLKMWVSFMIPKVEDGNNLGVEIQEVTLGEIQFVESEATLFFELISKYFIARAKLISKVVKYPHLDDYRCAVQELDEKEFLRLWLVMVEIRNGYCTLHDIVFKNLEKIKKPRSTNAVESLY